ncbi:MAG: hypothetical protein A7315_11520 [Candidatus Altiarchaeales archaeon WOR_SM1_79]|nr:MAG: hypothetical protein A7315_11520 [Candidatus Altiarchaeales archaeon WOR_SM1_79]
MTLNSSFTALNENDFDICKEELKISIEELDEAMDKAKGDKGIEFYCSVVHAFQPYVESVEHHHYASGAIKNRNLEKTVSELKNGVVKLNASTNEFKSAADKMPDAYNDRNGSLQDMIKINELNLQLMTCEIKFLEGVNCIINCVNELNESCNGNFSELTNDSVESAVSELKTSLNSLGDSRKCFYAVKKIDKGLIEPINNYEAGVILPIIYATKNTIISFEKFKGRSHPNESQLECTTDGECLEGKICENGKCVEKSIKEKIPATSEVKEEKETSLQATATGDVKICPVDFECPEGQVCEEGICVEKPPATMQ